MSGPGAVRECKGCVRDRLSGAPHRARLHHVILGANDRLCDRAHSPRRSCDAHSGRSGLAGGDRGAACSPRPRSADCRSIFAIPFPCAARRLGRVDGQRTPRASRSPERLALDARTDDRLARARRRHRRPPGRLGGGSAQHACRLFGACPLAGGAVISRLCRRNHTAVLVRDRISLVPRDFGAQGKSRRLDPVDHLAGDQPRPQRGRLHHARDPLSDARGALGGLCAHRPRRARRNASSFGDTRSATP